MFRPFLWISSLLFLIGSTPAMAAKVMAVNAKASRVIAMVSPAEKKLLTDNDKVVCKFPSGDMVGTRVSWKKKRLVVLEFESTPKVKRGVRFEIVAADGAEASATSSEGGDTTVANDGSSLAARSTKSLGAAALVTPLSDWFLQFGGSAFYKLSNSLYLGASILTGSKDLTGDFPDDDLVATTNVSVTGTAAWAWARYFIGNSFNLSGGIGMRQATALMQFDDKTSDIYLDMTIDLNSIVIPLTIGQEWTWDFGLTVGIDYVAYFAAISGGATVATESNSTELNSALESDRDDGAQIMGDIAQSGHLTLALITLGFQF